MLTFTAPWVFALFAVGALIAVFYFLRTRFHRVPVSSVYLWTRLIRVNEGGARLRRRSLLLLLLQLAVTALLVFALAGPQVTGSTPLTSGTAYVLDTSASMGAVEANGPRLELAGRAIVADYAGRRGPVAVFAGDGQFFSADGSGLREFLAQVHPGQGEFSEETAAAEVRAWTQTRGGNWRGVLVTDGGVDRGGTVLSQAFGGSLRTLDFASTAPNVGIVDLRVSGPRAQFTLFNGFAKPQTVTLSLTRGTTQRRVETLPPGISTVVWNLTEAGPGVWTAQLEGWTDALQADNTFRFSEEAPHTVRIAHYGEPNAFLSAAFTGTDYHEGGTGDLVLADGVLPPGRRPTVYFGVLPEGLVTLGPEVSGRVAAAGPGQLSRWVAWDDIEVKNGRGLIVPPQATVLAEVDGWPVAAEWTQDGARYLALGFDTKTSNIGLTSALPVLMRNFRQEVVPQDGNPLASVLTVGKTSLRAGSEAWHVEAGVDAVRRDGLWELTALRSGVFHWSDGAASGILAANIPAPESDTSPRAVPLPPPADTPTRATIENKMPLGWIPALLALLLLVIEWRLWNGRLHPRTNPVAAYLRGAAMAAALLALAGLNLPWPTTARNVILLVDVSGSQGPLIEQERQAALKYLGTLKAGDSAAVVEFGSQPRVLSGLLSVAQARSVLESAAWDGDLGSDTDLAAALAMGAELLKGGAGTGVQVLFSDGRATRGGSLAEIKAGPYRVYAVPFGRPLGGVAGEGLELPPARAGEQVAVQWRGWADADQTAMLQVAVDGQVTQRRQVALTAGPNAVTFAVDAGAAGKRRVDVSVGTSQTSGLLTVAGPRSALVVPGPEASSALVSALSQQGIAVEIRQPTALPESEIGYQGFSTVVLDNVPAQLSRRQETALKSWVANGGGLLVVGGSSSLGRGGYFSSGLEELLPVSTDSRRRVQFTRTRLLFVVDHSGSMSDLVGHTTKIEAAVSGVARTLQDLSPKDEVGILQFDSDASWVLPFTPVSNKSAILEALGSFSQGGGTELTSALDEVMKVFSAPGPIKRHVVLLTDGETGVDNDFYQRFTDTMRDADVSLTVLGIGDEVNEPLLRGLASGTGGVYYHAAGPDIPELLHSEAIRVTRDQVQEGHFTVTARDPNPALELETTPPPVLGYLVARPKPLARVGWVVARPEGVDPLYADWRYGAGHVAVFTSDSGRHWLVPWSGRAEYNRFWGQAVKSVAVTESKDLEVSVAVSASVAHVSVEARENGKVRSGARLAVTQELTVPMRETAPGHYEAELPLSTPGLAVFTVNDQVRHEQATSWAWTPPGAETARGGVDWAALSRFTSATGGRLEPASAPTPPEPKWAWSAVPLYDGLLTLSLLLLVVELGRRSLSVLQLKQALAAGSAWWRDQKRPWAAPESSPIRTTADAERRTREAYRYLAGRRKPNP
jgi:Mg-chelatase subunit ChlD